MIAKIDAKAPSITLKSGKIKTSWLAKAVAVARPEGRRKGAVSYEMVSKKPTASADRRGEVSPPSLPATRPAAGQPAAVFALDGRRIPATSPTAFRLP